MAQASRSLPVLVARFADDGVRDYLTGVARAGQAVYVPLANPPLNAGQHLLEVHTSGRTDPLILVAEPIGPKGEKGHPLRLALPPSASTGAASAAPSSGPTSAPASSGTKAPARGAADPLMGRSLASGKLTIERRVGEGGAGTVYRARHRDLQMAVAVKVMHEALQRDADFCRRFHAEALSASRLDHAHLTRVLDFGQEPDGLLYLAMEFLDGQSLREVLERDKNLDFARAAQLMIQVCSGLTHAHARGIVHRDIKPENLVLVRGLDEDGRETDIVKVCDFGIAHAQTEDAPTLFAGTVEYVSPEQFAGEKPDAQSDVYACGVVLYELLTGVVPIEGDMPEIVDRVLRVAPDPPSRRAPGLDPRVDRLVLKALAKDREVRHASVRELRAELKETVEEIALFSAGGYWNELAAGAAPSTAPSSGLGRAGRPSSGHAPPGDGPDWLERGTGSSMPAPAPRTSVPSPRSPRSSYVEIDAEELSRPAPISLLAPPSSSSSSSSPSSSPLAASSSGPPQSERAGGSSSVVPGSHVSMTPTSSSEADDVARVVAAFVKTLVATTDHDKFAALVAPVAPKIRALVEQGHATPAWKLCSTLTMIATEPARLASRGPAAAAALEVFSERALLARLAESALDPFKDRDGAARKLLARAGDAGAHAAYGARTKLSVFEARERFVAILHDLGPACLPTLGFLRTRLETLLRQVGPVAPHASREPPRR